MKRKLACFGLAFALAELFAAYQPPLVILPAAALFGLLLFFYRRQMVVPIFAGGFCGFLVFAVFSLCFVYPVQRLAGQTASCTVVVETDAEPSYQEGMVRGTLRVTEYNGQPANFLMECSAFPSSAPGEQFTARWELLPLAEDSYQMSYMSRGIYLQAEYQGGYQPQVRSNALHFRIFQWRQNLVRILKTWMPEAEGELEAAMLLGDKNGLQESIQDAFRTAGVSHLLAVSGLHVALLCGIFSFGRRRRFLRPLIALRSLLVIFYMALTGMPISVMRAGLVFLLALAGDFFLQPVDLLTSTGAAAVLLGLQNGYAPCDLGFQLSFCAVLGVQVATTLVQWEYTKLPEPTTLWKGRLFSVGLQIAETIQVAFFASLATLPALIAHGMTTSGVSVLTNLLVVWMLELALQIGIAILLLSIVPPLSPVMQMVSFVLSAWLHGMLWIVSWCAGLPLANLSLPQRYTMLVLFVLALLALLFWVNHQMVWYLPVAVLCTVTAVVLGLWAQKDVVRIALVGASNNPCVVCTENQAALIVFRGGQSNLRAVQRYLADNAEPEVALAVDLRQDPSALDFGSWPLLRAEESIPYLCQNILDDVRIDLYHDGGGNLLVLEIGNRHIAIAAGQITLPAPVAVDVLCAGSSLPEAVQPQTILSCMAAPAWMTEITDQTVLYGPEDPMITIRPDVSMIFQEVERLAL